jgi:hypothetical protein
MCSSAVFPRQKLFLYFDWRGSLVIKAPGYKPEGRGFDEVKF